MKDFIYQAKSKLALFLLVNLTCFNLGAQTYKGYEFQKKTIPNTGTFMEFYSLDHSIPPIETFHSEGLGSFFINPLLHPTSLFHIMDYLPLYTGAITLNSLFKVEAWTPGGMTGPNLLGSVENCKVGQERFYGLYQIGGISQPVINYFQNPIGIGVDPPSAMLDVAGNINASGDNTFRNGICNNKITLTGLYNSLPLIESKNYSLDFDLKRDCGDCPTGTTTVMHMSSTANGVGNYVEVIGLLKTKTFLMTTNPGLKKVLMSDEDGNGRWTDASVFNDNDWLEYPPKTKNIDPPPGEEVSLYVNPKYAKVGIGIMNPKSALAVNGKVTAKEFEATLDGFPDYVFNADYNLRSLKDLETYTQLYKHLPEIPSEKEVKEQGVKLAEMNALLVKKVEELTLYLYAMQKEIDALKAAHTSK
jgi:hypothetical protein